MIHLTPVTPVEAMQRCALFKEFTETGLKILAGIAVSRATPAGTPLFVENMVGDSLLVVVDGRVTLSLKGRQNEDMLLGEIGPGDAIGELALISTGQRQCTAMATTPVTFLEIRQSDFQKLMATKPQACLKLLMAICSTFGQKLLENRDALKSLVRT